MSHRCLTELRNAPSPLFYETALQYGHYLWRHGHAGRAILAITRALYADVRENDPILRRWPLPYAAYRWILSHHPRSDFPGNPRVSFQHQATRLRGPRKALRRTRAWAVWAIVREHRPELPGDPGQPVREPTPAEIESYLGQLGHDNEVDLWKRALATTAG